MTTSVIVDEATQSFIKTDIENSASSRRACLPTSYTQSGYIKYPRLLLVVRTRSPCTVEGYLLPLQLKRTLFVTSSEIPFVPEHSLHQLVSLYHLRAPESFRQMHLEFPRSPVWTVQLVDWPLFIHCPSHSPPKVWISESKEFGQFRDSAVLWVFSSGRVSVLNATDLLGIWAHNLLTCRVAVCCKVLTNSFIEQIGSTKDTTEKNQKIDTENSKMVTFKTQNSLTPNVIT